jgi:WD40 repeat protein
MLSKKSKKAQPPAAPRVGAPPLSEQPLPKGSDLIREISLAGRGNQLAAAPMSNRIAVATSIDLTVFNSSDWSVAARRKLSPNEPFDPTGLAFSPDATLIASCERDEVCVRRTADLSTMWRSKALALLGRVAWSPNRPWIATGTEEGRSRIFDAANGETVATLSHTDPVFSLLWSPDGAVLATGGDDGVLRIWGAGAWLEQHRIELFTSPIYSLAWSPDGKYLAAGAADRTIRIVRMTDLHIEAVLEAHTGSISQLDFSRDSRVLISCAPGEQRLWNTQSWSMLGRIPGSRRVGIHNASVFDRMADQIVTFSPSSESIDVWHYDLVHLLAPSSAAGGRYVNAKVVLVGDTGVGKSGLGLVLSGQKWTETGSTHGRHVWVFAREPVKTNEGQNDMRETLLWDLAGQPDYRLVHQLHLTDVAIALIVFDSRSQTDPLAGVKYWNRALRQAKKTQGEAAIPMKKFLVAARSDVGRVGFSADRRNKIVEEFNFDLYFETSAKEGWGVEELRSAIAKSIDWSALPVVSSNRVFEEIKQFLLSEKTDGRLLSTAEDLYRSFSTVRPRGDLRAEFETCIGRLESRGLIQRLSFGNLVLLQPEIRDAYASALVSAAKDEPDGLGSIREEDARVGNFKIPADQRLKDPHLERLLLISTAEELLKHEIALREHGDDGAYLVFPSQLTRENPELPDAEGKSAVFTFDGPVTNIYATLVVRLSHSGIFTKKELWKNAAAYTAWDGGTYGIFLNEIGEGRGKLTLFYTAASSELQQQFEQYVETHLRRRALPESIHLRRIYSCPVCNVPLSDAAVRKRMELGLDWMYCNVCEPAVRISIDGPAATPAGTAPSPRLVEMDRAADARRDKETAASVIDGKRQTKDFDVFLCHNSVDKPIVRQISKKLQERGVLPWLDEVDLPPFVSWQDELERTIESIKSVAVFIGPSLVGPWQDMEIKSFLQESVNRKIRIGLVLLPGATQTVKLPLFLRPFQWIDFNKTEPDPFQQLVWGITGERPSPYSV